MVFRQAPQDEERFEQYRAKDSMNQLNGYS